MWSLIYKILKTPHLVLNRLNSWYRHLSTAIRKATYGITWKYFRLMGYIEKKYILSKIESEDSGKIKPKYTSVDEVEEELLNRGAEIVEVEESELYDPVAWRFTTLKYHGKTVEMCWKFITMGIERKCIKWYKQ